MCSIRRTCLTLGGFGVVLPERLVFGDVWEEEAERVLRDVVRRHHLVRADDVGQRDGAQLFLCVRLHRVEDGVACVGRCRPTTSAVVPPQLQRPITGEQSEQ